MAFALSIMSDLRADHHGGASFMNKQSLLKAPHSQRLLHKCEKIPQGFIKAAWDHIQLAEAFHWDHVVVFLSGFKVSNYSDVILKAK